MTTFFSLILWKMLLGSFMIPLATSAISLQQVPQNHTDLVNIVVDFVLLILTLYGMLLILAFVAGWVRILKILLFWVKF